MKSTPPRSALRSRACIFAAFGLALVVATKVRAVPVEIDLGPHTITSETPRITFDALNGTLVAGQTLAVDFMFSNSEFVRLFTVTSTLFDAAIKLQTNGSGFLGFLEGTGYLIDVQGNAIPGFGITGGGSGDDGSMGIGLFPLLKDKDGTPNTDLLRPLDFSGIHFDLTFPDLHDPSIHVTGGQFALFSDGKGVFGIGPRLPRDIVPDSANTLFLLGMSVGAMIAARTRLTQAT